MNIQNIDTCDQQQAQIEKIQIKSIQLTEGKQ